jgi:hypothetical protein
VFYLYDPNAMPWTDRFYGVFRSPIEGSVVLSFVVLLLLAAWDVSRVRKFGVLGVIVLGILLTKTLTAALAAAAALGIVYAARLPKRWAPLFWFGAPFAGVVLTITIRNTAFFAEKSGNFLFRLKPWSVYFNSAFSRVDRLLLGNGFHPHFSDDIYVFLFSRGGLLLLGFAVALFVGWWRRTGKFLDPLPRAVPIFFLISGLTVDSLIIRPVAYVLICVGVLALKPRLRSRP